MVLVIPLAIAFVVVLGAAMFGRIRTENRSRASYDGTKQCVAACNKTGIAARFIKDKAACVLDCPAVVAQTMTCNQFCSENVKVAAGTTPNDNDWSSQDICKKQCNQWVTKGGSPTPSVSGIPQPTPTQFNCTEKCQSVPTAYKPLCTLTCNQFNTGKKTCPKGCSSGTAQIKQTCMQLFCSTE